MTDDMFVFKIFVASEAALLIATGQFEGSADDRRDGFIHLSTRRQLDGTLVRHFSDKRMLYLGFCPVARLGDALRMEPSRDGVLFPHLFRTLQASDLAALVPIPEVRDGWEPPILGTPS